VLAYPTELKPYGRALAEAARRRRDILCLTGDLTTQTEVDMFQAEFPDRFIHGGMAEANIMGMAGALTRCGFVPFVHTFGVFATRRPFDQIANAIAYPNLPVRIIGFMPGVSTPGGPSHQAIDDVALMPALPNMTVVDVADAVETRQVVPAIMDVPGPVYVRLKRGEIPVIFDDSHTLRLDRADVVVAGTDVALFASGMMLATALAASRVLGSHGVSAGLMCDITLAAEDAVIFDLHYDIGSVPADGIHNALQELLGVKRAAYALLTGEAITARQAPEWGMVNEVVPRERLVERAYQIADHIMTQPRTVRRLTTQIVRRPWKQRIVNDLDGGFGIQMFGHIAKKRAVHGSQHISSTIDYVREGRKNNFD
jgi:transketolase C-terminal domain/subunit